jgi:probable rRNA maturation factor
MNHRKAEGRGRDRHTVTRTTLRPLLSHAAGKGMGRGEGLAGANLLDVVISNRQHTRKVQLRLLRQIVIALLNDVFELRGAELGITLVATKEMTRMNGAYLQHEGSTDVITFNHSGAETQNLELETRVHGEVFICVDEAVLQARRFRTTWQSEMVRYIVHGVLHLLGYDDHSTEDRQRMKLQEDRLLRRLTKEFDLRSLSSPG